LRRFRIKTIFKETIEPEEILLDAAKPSELDDQKIEVPIRPRIFRIFFGIIAVVFLVLAGQAAYLQLWRGGYLKALAEKNRTRALPLTAARGIIYDQSGQQLVYNISSFDLVATWADLPRQVQARQAVVEKVAGILGISGQEIEEDIRSIDVKVGSSVTIVSNLAHDKLLQLQGEINNLPGFRIEPNTTRQYVNGPSLSHVLGYLGKLTGDEIKQNPDYFLTEKIGKDGLEATYEKVLRGQPGQRLFEVDALGRVKGQVAEQKSQDGQGLVLAIDSRLQSSLYEGLRRALAGRALKKGAAVALDPQTGGVLALVSFPSFDNNLFAQGLSAKDYQELLDNPTKPLFNRAVAGQYPPGSTVKPLIGSAALQEKVITPTTKIHDTGEIVLTNQYYPDVVYRFADWKAHGTVDIYAAIAQSCDVFFYTIGGGYGKIEGLGIERLTKYFKLFGFGSILGVDLPGEDKGLVPDDQWKQTTKGERWYTGDTYHVSIGQGDLLVTPLQLAAATAAIINGGQVVRPHVVDKIIDSDKNVIETIKPKVLQSSFINEENLAVIKEGMRQTVTSGSALLLNNLSVAAGAKTGTAQVAGARSPNAWGVAFAPYDNPKLVLVVLAENAGEGSQVAIPVIYEALQNYFKN